MRSENEARLVARFSGLGLEAWHSVNKVPYRYADSIPTARLRMHPSRTQDLCKATLK